MNEFLSTINVFQYVDFRKEVIKRCIVSSGTWSNWVNGGTISAKYKSIINKVAMEMFGRPVFDGEGGVS